MYEYAIIVIVIVILIFAMRRGTPAVPSKEQMYGKIHELFTAGCSEAEFLAKFPDMNWTQYLNVSQLYNIKKAPTVTDYEHALMVI